MQISQVREPSQMSDVMSTCVLGAHSIRPKSISSLHCENMVVIDRSHESVTEIDRFSPEKKHFLSVQTLHTDQSLCTMVIALAKSYLLTQRAAPNY